MLKKILHRIAHFLHLIETEEVIVFDQSHGMEMSHRNRCVKCRFKS